ncbi:hypothetical protein BJX68DRAFT_237924 [Aspergillus pseudodeflectus]|uniref:Leucine-rich repeat domain-containing protein n=1 Tax=Aspergillus pseudodeflectus TaxID=176178 RepID=A0ABR4KAS4_9EURO
MLQAIPTEIQLIITQQLGDHDKLSLLRTSRHFYNCVQPLIYENLSPRSSHSLVDTLVRKPALCKYPRCLRLTAWDTPYPWARDNGRNMDLDMILRRYDISPVLAKAREASLSEKEAMRWERDLKKENPDAWIALLLTLLPNLRRLEIQFPDRSTYVPQVILRAAAGQFSMPVLQHLEEVLVSAAFAPYGLVTSLVLPFFGLPALRSVFTDALFDGESGVAIGSSPVKHLSIGNCGGGLRSLSNLIKNCPNLESYRHGFFPFNVWPPLGMDHPIYPALLQARHTLKTLWLDIELVPELEEPIFPSFAEFTILQFLHAPHGLLGQFYRSGIHAQAPVPDLTRILPPSLKELHITKIHGAGAINVVAQSLINYIQSKGVHMTDIVVFTTPVPVELAMPPSVSDTELLLRLADLCRRLRIGFAKCDPRDQRTLKKGWRFEKPFPDRDTRMR